MADGSGMLSIGNSSLIRRTRKALRYYEEKRIPPSRDGDLLGISARDGE